MSNHSTNPGPSPVTDPRAAFDAATATQKPDHAEPRPWFQVGGVK